MMPADAWQHVTADESACPICGRESCEDAHETPSGPTFVPAAKLITAPRPVAVIAGLAWASSVTVLASESGSGKTFVLLDLSAAVSAGLPWHGRATKQGTVAYLSFEGDALGVRLRAIRDHKGGRLDHVYVLRGTDALSPVVDRDRIETPSLGELAATAALDALQRTDGPIRLVIIDTVRASLAGSEDSSEAVAAYLRAIRRLLTHAPDAGLILAHHTGWQDGESPRKRERGSSAWRGNADATLYLEAGAYDSDRGEAAITLRTLKTRDSERPPVLSLIRRRVELAEMAGDDLRDGAVTSCVIVPDPRTAADRETARRQTEDAEALALDQRILRIITTHRVTSLDAIRGTVGLRKADVSTAVSRLVDRGWLDLPQRGRAYTATPAGQAAITAGAV